MTTADTLEWAKQLKALTLITTKAGYAGRQRLWSTLGAQRYNYILENDDVTVKIFKEAREAGIIRNWWLPSVLIFSGVVDGRMR